MLKFNTVPSFDLSSQEIRTTKLTDNRLQKHRKAHVLLAVMAATHKSIYLHENRSSKRTRLPAL